MPDARRLLQSALRVVAAAGVVFGIVSCVVRQPVLTRGATLDTRVDPSRLESHVRFLSIDCFPRHFLARANQQKAIGYIAAELRSAGGRVELQDIVTSSGTYQNVIAHFGPERGPRYVVGAHFDSCGVQPGADDNASGVAGLIELAHLLGKASRLPAHFEIVAYNLEEPPYFAGPYMGSSVHARTLKEAKADVALMLALEMIGCFSDERGSQSYPVPLMKLMYPSRGNFIALVGKWDQREVVARFKQACMGTADIPVVSLAAPSFVPAVDFSDHRNYWDAGYPALLITDTAFLRNPRYHLPSDTAYTLDYRRMAEVVKLLHAGLMGHSARIPLQAKSSRLE